MHEAIGVDLAENMPQMMRGHVLTKKRRILPFIRDPAQTFAKKNVFKQPCNIEASLHGGIMKFFIPSI
jgi:hypothetical protein